MQTKHAYEFRCAAAWGCDRWDTQKRLFADYQVGHRSIHAPGLLSQMLKVATLNRQNSFQNHHLCKRLHTAVNACKILGLVRCCWLSWLDERHAADTCTSGQLRQHYYSICKLCWLKHAGRIAHAVILVNVSLLHPGCLCMKSYNSSLQRTWS